jgi:hypothetical protein
MVADFLNDGEIGQHNSAQLGHDLFERRAKRSLDLREPG